MVQADSHRIPRVPWYSGLCTTYIYACFVYRAFTFYDQPSQNCSTTHIYLCTLPVAAYVHTPLHRQSKCYGIIHSSQFRLLPVRSPLLRESLLLSSPPGTEMFHFPGYRFLSDFWSPTRWVAPFGYRRIKRCSLLPDAFRSLPRPSSPAGAKASTIYPY